MNPDRVRAYLLAQGAPVATVEVDDPLFSSGRVDSFLLVDLLFHIESEGGRPIDPATLRLTQIDTLRALASLASTETP